MRDRWPVGWMLGRRAGLGAWSAQRVALAAVAAALLLSAAWLGQIAPLLAQETDAEAAADPKSVAEVRISGLSGTLTYGGSDSFTVTASNLTTVVGYDVIVSRNNGTLGIGACGTGSQTQRVSGVTSQDLSFTVHACWAGSGTVTAVVRRSGLTINENAYSQAVTVQATAPQAPKRPSAPKPQAREFTAQWQAPSNTGGTALTGYRVVMRKDGASWPADDSSDVKKVGASTRSQRFSGLLPNRIYWFRVKACNGANQTRCSGWSPQASVTLPIGRPREPTWGDFESKSTQIRVSWSAPDDTGGVGLTGYGLRHWQKGGTEPSSAQVTVNAQTSARAFTGLTPNTTYRFSIQACNGTRPVQRVDQHGRDDAADTDAKVYAALGDDEARPGGANPSSRPRDASLARGLERAGRRGLGDHALRRPDTGKVPPAPGRRTEVSSRTSTTITGLTNGTSYQVKVRAANTTG